MAIRFLVLTAKRIAALAPGESAQENGIIASCLRNGDIRWSINTMVDGERIHRVLGTESAGASRQQAERAIESLRTMAREQRLALPRQRKVHRTLRAASADYVERLRREGGKNVDQKDRHLRLHLLPRLGSLPINKINKERLAAYRRQRLADGVKDSTINRELSTLSNFFHMALEWHWVTANDVPKVEQTPEPKMPFRILSLEELAKLFAAAKERHQLLFLEMMGGSAMRPEEVMKARFEQVGDERDVIYIPEAKAGDRVQPITASLARRLRHLRRLQQQVTGSGAGWIFPSPLKKAKKGRHRVNYQLMFARCLKDAKLDDQAITPYTIRRTSITDVAATGIDLAALMQISGHKSVASLLRYIHPRERVISQAMQALERGRWSAIKRRRGRRLHQNCTRPNLGSETERGLH